MKKIAMEETELRKQIEEQLSKYNKLKEPFVSRSAGLRHSYGWFGDYGPTIATEIWLTALIGSFVLYMLPLPEILHNIALGIMTISLLLTLFVGIIGNIGESIWKANEPRKNRRIDIKNRKLYKQLLGIDYNYPNYDNVDYIIAVINNEIVQEKQEIPENPREAYRNSFAYTKYTRYKSNQSQSRKATENKSERAGSANNESQASGHDKNDYTKSRADKGNSKICPKCGGQLIIRKGPYGKFYGCRNYPKCRYTRSLKR